MGRLRLASQSGKIDVMEYGFRTLEEALEYQREILDSGDEEAIARLKRAGEEIEKEYGFKFPSARCIRLLE